MQLAGAKGGRGSPEVSGERAALADLDEPDHLCSRERSQAAGDRGQTASMAAQAGE